MKLIYLCSAYTHPKKRTRDKREREVTEAAAFLQHKHKNVAFYLPITQSAAMKRFNDNLGTEFKFWSKIDLFIISEKADEIWVLCHDGWKESVGVQAEINCANYLGKKIQYIHPKTFKRSKTPW